MEFLLPLLYGTAIGALFVFCAVAGSIAVAIAKIAIALERIADKQ